MLETRMWSINLEAILVRNRPIITGFAFGSFFVDRGCECSFPIIRYNTCGQVRIGAISTCSSFRSLGDISSGPEALFGLRPMRRPSTHLSFMVISGYLLTFLGF